MEEGVALAMAVIHPICMHMNVDTTCMPTASLPHSIQQRSGKKTLTTVQGISVDYDLKLITKAFKKVRV